MFSGLPRNVGSNRTMYRFRANLTKQLMQTLKLCMKSSSNYFLGRSDLAHLLSPNAYSSAFRLSSTRCCISVACLLREPSRPCSRILQTPSNQAYEAFQSQCLRAGILMDLRPMPPSNTGTFIPEE